MTKKEKGINMDKQSKVEEILRHSMGTSCYRYNDITKMANVVYTDAIKEIADEVGAWWLVNMICSLQPKVKEDLEEGMQFWTLKVNSDNSAVLVCERDTDDPIHEEKIGYTDFPMSEFRVWLELGQTSMGNGPQLVMVMMVPEER